MKMKILAIAVILASQTVMADVLVTDEGATCDIPDRYNAAPYDEIYNRKGVKDFCEFPQQKWDDAFFKLIKNCQETGLVYPICTDGELVLSPTLPIRPCYKLVTD